MAQTTLSVVIKGHGYIWRPNFRLMLYSVTLTSTRQCYDNVISCMVTMQCFVNVKLSIRCHVIVTKQKATVEQCARKFRNNVSLQTKEWTQVNCKLIQGYHIGVFHAKLLKFGVFLRHLAWKFWFGILAFFWQFYFNLATLLLTVTYQLQSVNCGGSSINNSNGLVYSDASLLLWRICVPARHFSELKLLLKTFVFVCTFVCLTIIKTFLFVCTFIWLFLSVFGNFAVVWKIMFVYIAF